MNEIYLFNESGSDIDLGKIKELLHFATQKEKLSNITFNVIFGNDVTIKKLNQQYRKKNSTTDVLAFPYQEDWSKDGEKKQIGEIYISVEIALKQAQEYQHSLTRELAFLAVHGFYHLIGYDHQTVDDENKMFQKQEEVLKEYGIKRGN